MRASPIAVFAAGFVAGGIVLGGVLAHARIITLNASIAGVLPDSEGSLFCAAGNSTVRAVVGVTRPSVVNATGGGASTGVTMRCPP